jgi:uncharacterized protein YdeI (YjbR/CyaY-like superfamily)
MTTEPKLFFKTRAKWRTWLQKHHLETPRVWLIYYKKNSGKASISYNDAVEEALCFGWIDGQVKKIDELSFMQRFTPRRPRSRWSETNIKRVKKLIREGMMTQYGLEIFKKGVKESDPVPSSKNFSVPRAFEKDLGKNKKSLRNFGLLSASAKMMYVFWINSAKQEKTRLRRMNRMIKFLEAGPNPLTKMPTLPVAKTTKNKNH